VVEISDGIRRVTFPLPWQLDHVHSYLLEADDGWIVVDTGLGTPDAREQWSQTLSELAAPVSRIVITHFHPDHIGGTGHLVELTGAPVSQSPIDHETACSVWGEEGWALRLAAWYRNHGLSAALADEVIDEAATLRANVLWPRTPEFIRPGDRLKAAGEDWEVVPMPGHADGQIVLLGVQTGRMIAADHILAPISPNIGLHPESAKDPLGDYLTSLQRTIALAPSICFGGHHHPIEDPVNRAEELRRHHHERLETTISVLGGETLSGYQVSLRLFGAELPTHGRRFAVAETLAHLVRLEIDEQIVRVETDSGVQWSHA
jgi:glyoxylase-like metal-dependent hydrolase (beta-lactamase superfamily II)